MRKVGFVKSTLVFSLCLICGAGFSFVAAYAFKPLPVAEARIPVTNFDNIQGLRGGSIYSNDPFRLTLPVDVTIPDAPSVPAMPDGMSEQDGILVLGVLPPDVCIVSIRGKTYTCKIGDNIPPGTVDSITSKGVFVGGTFYRIK